MGGGGWGRSRKAVRIVIVVGLLDEVDIEFVPQFGLIDTQLRELLQVLEGHRLLQWQIAHVFHHIEESLECLLGQVSRGRRQQGIPNGVHCMEYRLRRCALRAAGAFLY